MLGVTERQGEIADMGEQARRGIAAPVDAGRGKREARSARGIWAGKSELDNAFGH